MADIHGDGDARDSVCRIAPGLSPCDPMSRDFESSENRPTLPMRVELEARLQTKVVTYEKDGQERPGGMCGCCGSGPNVDPSWRSEPWYVYRAGLCDADGVYYAQLCEGCLEDIRAENAKRPQTFRDEIAREVSELLGDDIDGAQTLMDDFDIDE